MKKIGILYGCDLYIDGKSERWIIQAENKLQELFEKEYRIKTDEELDEEVSKTLTNN